MCGMRFHSSSRGKCTYRPWGVTVLDLDLDPSSAHTDLGVRRFTLETFELQPYRRNRSRSQARLWAVIAVLTTTTSE